GDTDDGRRVVVIPTLTCEARGVTPMCDECQAGRTNRCGRTGFGHVEPGLQIGFCEDTGGGWGSSLMAHRSQSVEVPADLSDEDAVMIEPAACAINAARRVPPGDVAVIGAGTIGLLTLAALRSAGGRTIIVAAKHPAQQAWAEQLGADAVVAPGALAAA